MYLVIWAVRVEGSVAGGLCKQLEFWPVLKNIEISSPQAFPQIILMVFRREHEQQNFPHKFPKGLFYLNRAKNLLLLYKAHALQQQIFQMPVNTSTDKIRLCWKNNIS